MKRSRSEYWKARSTKRRAIPEYREAQKERYSQWYESKGKTPERMKRKAEQMRASAARNADKVKARRRVRSAIERGDLIRMPCEVCAETLVHAHHDDYTKPLIVRWLCRKHHDKIHTKATNA